MPLCCCRPINQSASAGRCIAPKLTRDRRWRAIELASDGAHTATLGAQDGEFLSFGERKVAPGYRFRRRQNVSVASRPPSATTVPRQSTKPRLTAASLERPGDRRPEPSAFSPRLWRPAWRSQSAAHTDPKACIPSSQPPLLSVATTGRIARSPGQAGDDTCMRADKKTWMPGTNPGMTGDRCASTSNAIASQVVFAARPMRPRWVKPKPAAYFRPIAERAVDADMGEPDHRDRQHSGEARPDARRHQRHRRHVAVRGVVDRWRRICGPAR